MAMTVPMRFAHANVNASDVEVSEAFYTTCFGFVPQWRTAPAEPQDGTGFGMAGQLVRWEGVLLADHRGTRGPVVDLLEWKQPPTEGVPYRERSHLGLAAYLFAVGSLDDAVARLNRAGAPVERGSYRTSDEAPVDMVITADPDGTVIEVIGDAAGITYRGVRVNCSDLARSAGFYAAAIHLDSDPPRSIEQSGGDGLVAARFGAQRMYLPGQRDAFSVELTQWEDPAPVGTPYASGNHAGIYRLALTVEDMDASLEDLRNTVADAPPAVIVELGPGLPPVKAAFFPDPDGATVEFIERGLR
jgi:catechol 2,3-dioxygenase-like lactoylglutathione lyase family enzyme